MSDPIMLHGLLMIVGVFVAPALGFVLFFLWLEQKELMDQNVALQERVRAAERDATQAWVEGYDCARFVQELHYEDAATYGPPSYCGTSESNRFGGLHG